MEEKMKSKKIVPFVIYLLGVLPIVYTLINVQCRDKNYIEFRYLALNWAVGYDNLRHYMDSEVYICLAIIALLTTVLFLA